MWHRIPTSEEQRMVMGVLLKFLCHRIRNFHTAMFNRIIENLIMMVQIFHSSNMYCNAKQSDGITMGEKDGCMKAADLSRANEYVWQYQSKSIQRFSAPEIRYRKTIRSSCESPPAAKEAAWAALVKYFALLCSLAFPPPYMFITVTPDDLRNYRILVDSFRQTQYVFGAIDLNYFTGEQNIGFDIVRQDARVKYLIIEAVTKHIFCWSEKVRKLTAVGWSTDVLWWHLATTEEQGRKSLHCHILVFVHSHSQ